MSWSTFLFVGSTLVLFVWGILDWREGHRRDGVFLLLLSFFDGAAAWDSHQAMTHVEQQLAPRHLTSGQRDQFRAGLTNTPKMPITILENTDVTSDEEDEQYGFADDIRRTFEDAGWTVHTERVAFPRRARLPTGIAVWGPPGTTLQGLGAAFEALRFFPTIGYPEAEELAGAPVSAPVSSDGRPIIRIDVFGRPPPS